MTAGCWDAPLWRWDLAEAISITTARVSKKIWEGKIKDYFKGGRHQRKGRLIEKGRGEYPLRSMKKTFSSDIPKIRNFCKIPKPSPSSKAVHAPPFSLYFSNIIIYKPYGLNATIDTAIYINLKVTLTHSQKSFFWHISDIYQYIS